MQQKLKHRGPDAGGIYAQGNIALGHRRLSIIDTVQNSQQPMVDPFLGLAIVFNGCIYNYRELRAELSRLGYKFFSDGDTEVILKAYHAWGKRCVERFYGMFAFVIVERDSGRIVLARDRLGIKPLYYSEQRDRFVFASTLPAILAAGGCDTSIDHKGLHQYLSLHATVAAPDTIIAGVKKLPAATLMVIDRDGRKRQEKYWSFDIEPRAEDARMTEADWTEALRSTLSRAIRRRLVADVPSGILLSGGLDSSLIVAMQAEYQSNIKTFSIGFENAGGYEGNEYAYSDLIAQEFGTHHHRIHIGSERMIDAVPASIEAMSEPMVSHDSIGFFLLSQEVSKYVKVVQCGQGADELFGGYHWYQKLKNSKDVMGDYAATYFDRDHEEMREVLEPDFVEQDYSRELVSDYLNRVDKSAIDKVLELDTRVMMIEDPVKRVDNMTMAWGLEARVPLLDHEVAELAARMPVRYKLENGGKRILKDVARGLVPDSVIDRPKGYFPVPAFKAMSGKLLDYVRQLMESPAARQRGVFRQKYVQKLLAQPSRYLTPKGNSKLWQLAVLEQWLQLQKI